LLFSRYISDVLPSLGEKNMRQVTLYEFFSRRLQGLNVESLFDHYERQDELTETQKQLDRYKSSVAFMKRVKNYAKNLPSTDFEFTYVTFNGEIVFAKEDITKLYDSFAGNLTLGHRFNNLKKKLIKQLDQIVAKEATSPVIQDQLENLSDEQYHELLGEHEMEFSSYDEEQAYFG